ncbi:MAG: sulfotransferase [Bacteroidota bacterium]
MSRNKTIIYIIGAGRSGTTLLDVLLGNAKGIFSGGELNRYAIDEGIVKGLESKPERTIFWDTFGKEFLPQIDLDHQKDVHHKVEYHTQYLKRLLGLKDAKAYKEYQNYLEKFYQMLFDRIDEDIVVDSSKYPGRALAMSDTLNYRTCYLYIKRDPVQVVRSFAKTDVYIPTKSWSSANLYYLLVNSLCQYTLKMLRPKHAVHEIRYEDLILNTDKVLNDIEEAFDLDLSTVKQKVANDEYLEVGELFAGHTLRMQERIKLRKKLSAKPDSSIKDKVTRIINSPVYTL